MVFGKNIFIISFYLFLGTFLKLSVTKIFFVNWTLSPVRKLKDIIGFVIWITKTIIQNRRRNGKFVLVPPFNKMGVYTSPISYRCVIKKSTKYTKWVSVATVI